MSKGPVYTLPMDLSFVRTDLKFDKLDGYDFMVEAGSLMAFKFTGSRTAALLTVMRNLNQFHQELKDFLRYNLPRTMAVHTLYVRKKDDTVDYFGTVEVVIKEGLPAYKIPFEVQGELAPTPPEPRTMTNVVVPIFGNAITLPMGLSLLLIDDIPRGNAPEFDVGLYITDYLIMDTGHRPVEAFFTFTGDRDQAVTKAHSDIERFKHELQAALTGLLHETMLCESIKLRCIYREIDSPYPFVMYHSVPALILPTECWGEAPVNIAGMPLALTKENREKLNELKRKDSAQPLPVEKRLSELEDNNEQQTDAMVLLLDNQRRMLVVMEQMQQRMDEMAANTARLIQIQQELLTLINSDGKNTRH